MVKIARNLFCFAVLVFFSFAASAQSSDGAAPKDELVLSMHAFSMEKSMDAFSNQINSMGGIVLAGTCKHLNFIMLKVDLNIYGSKEKVTNSLKNAGYFFEIRNASIDDVRKLCKDPFPFMDKSK
jgi:hypothetical protein